MKGHSLLRAPFMMTTGRKKSPLWDFFLYDADTRKTTCQTQGCKWKCTGKNPTFPKFHLQRNHPEEYKKFEDQRAKKPTSSTSTVSTSSDVGHIVTRPTCDFFAPSVYKKDNPRQITLDRKMVLAFVANNIPLSVAENAEFRQWIKELNPSFVIPSRGTLSKEYDHYANVLKGVICERLKRAKNILLITDVWSKRGLSESFLGVRIRFFCCQLERFQNFTIAVRSFPSPHTGNAIRELTLQICKEFGIEPSSVFRVLTDDAANMRKAYQAILSLTEDNQYDDNEDQSDEDRDEDSPPEGIEELLQEAFGEQHLRCVSHLLQTSLTAFEKSSFGCSVLKKARDLCTKIRHSGKATEELIQRAGKTVVRDVKVRWSSTFLLLQRLLDISTHVDAVCQVQRWDPLLPSEWSMLEMIMNLLKPYAEATDVVAKERGTPICKVIPMILDIISHLDSFPSEFPQAADVCSQLKEKFIQKFGKYFDAAHPQLEPIYLIATYLHPANRHILTDDQLTVAKTTIQRCLKKQLPSINRNETEESIHQNASSPPQVSGALALAAAKRQEARLKALNLFRQASSPEEKILRDYEERSLLSKETDPVVFWMGQRSGQPEMSTLALQILAILPSAACLERVFSQAGIVSAGKRCNLSGLHLEREILLRCNKDLL